ncbi:MAG: cysteine desulfurase family protein [Candidatus Izemoplasmatales bacterium]|jgi:cysteine desulfurase
MIYLDYSATTPVNRRVLDFFCTVSEQCYGNANSTHQMGKIAKEKIDLASKAILKMFDTDNHEVIYTSGASEANNLAIKGVAFRKQHLGKHIITSVFEHPSVTTCMGYLQNQGYDIEFAPTNNMGVVDVDALRNMIRSDTILVSIAGVNSEIGIIQPINEIGLMMKMFPFATFHSDLTQAVGKIPITITNIDLVTFSAHKFYGLKGIGALLRKTTTILEPQIHGGKSTTESRSGTPAVSLICSMEKALDLAVCRLDSQYRIVFGLKKLLLAKLALIPNVVVNSNDACLPHIVNLSVLSKDAHTMVDILDRQGIMVSMQTACYTGSQRSESVYRLTNNEQRAQTSFRISISYLTTLLEIDALIDVIEKAA